SFTESQQRILIRGTDESNAPRAVLSGKSVMATSWSPDGRTLALTRIDKKIEMGFSSLDGKAEWFAPAAFERWGEVFSPDGRWFTHSSAESGQSEIWVRSFPDGKMVRQISVDGGVEA